MSKCSVQNCDNTDGVVFPINTEERHKWITSLKLETQLDENSIVCLDHFRQIELNNSNTEVAGNILLGNLEDTVISSNINQISNTQYEQIFPGKDSTTVCRLCATQDHLEKSIYEKIQNETIMTMIMVCCYPITITEDDGLPNLICSSCLKVLQIAYNFRKKCLQVDELWQNTKQSSQKRKQDDICSVNKRKCLKDVSPDNDDGHSYVSQNISKSCNINDSSEIIFGNEPPPLVPIEKNGRCTKLVKYITADITKSADGKEVYTDTNTDTTLVVTKKKMDYQVIECKNDMVIVPEGITVTPQKKFQSSIGIHSCVLTHGLQKSIFVMADGYLFTFGLLKGNIRHLRCVLPNCKAKAEQMLLTDNTYEDKIRVKVPHSHKAPTDKLQKKHMFFHVMRKRMQHDKTLNIRSIYEQVCTQEPEIRQLVPLRNVINEICKHQVSNKLPRITSFEEFYEKIEDECFEKLHFTNSNKQFYQERFRTEDGCMAVVFCNTDILESVSQSTLMYVDASFKIDTYEHFKYQLVTVLVWVDDSYYPILFALVNKKTREIFKKVFQYLHDVLAPNLRPHEIVTDYEANLYYSLGETYLEAHIGGSVFYYTQNLYKKICSLNLSGDLETNSNFRNLYHMLLMLPLLPVNTIADALNNIEVQSKEAGLSNLTGPIIDHIRSQWILNVTTEMFCVHRLENRINENVIAPFKKFRDYLLLFKGKVNQTHITIGQVVEKLIELESFLHDVYNKSDKKSFSRDLSSFQKKNVIRAWQYIETHPKININNFFQKILGYVKCMENQLWIWGFYRYSGHNDDVLISVASSSAYAGENCQIEEIDQEVEELKADETVVEYVDAECQNSVLTEEVIDNPTIVMEAVIDNDGGVVLQSNNVLSSSSSSSGSSSKYEKTFFKYIRYE